MRPILILSVLAGLVGSQLQAQTNHSNSLTNAVSLDELVVEALTHNPEIKFYQAEIAAAKAGGRTAGAWSNPELSTSIGQKSVRGGGFSSEGVAWSVSIMQPIEWPGRIGLRKAIANRDIESAELGLERFKTAIAGRMRSAAFALFAAREKSRAAGEVAERLKDLREVLVQRDPAGLTPLLEFRVIEASELTAQRRANDAAIAEKSALLELNQVRGTNSSAAIQLTEPAFVFPKAQADENLIGLARTNNFELRIRAVELAQQGFKVALAKKERFPALSIGPSISEERAGDRERIIGVGLSIPLPLWNRNQGGIEAAEARQIQAEASYQVLQREIERKVLDAAFAYQRSNSHLEKWRPDSVKHFKEAAELADRHYRLGAVPVSTYVELQDKYLEAIESLLDTRKDALEAAQQIENLTGTRLILENGKEKP